MSCQGYRWSPTESPDYLKEGKKKGTPGPGPADPCSHWYPGRRPFEAPEVNNIANHITRLPNLEGFLDLRSYGQMGTQSSFTWSTLIPYPSLVNGRVSTPFIYLLFI